MRRGGPELEAFIDESMRRCQAKGFHPRTFIAMRQRHGTIRAISKLVQSGELQSGFKKLKELGLLDWTVEAAVARFPHEFSPETRDCAAFRLRMASEGNQNTVASSAEKRHTGVRRRGMRA